MASTASVLTVVLCFAGVSLLGGENASGPLFWIISGLLLLAISLGLTERSSRRERLSERRDYEKTDKVMAPLNAE
jgi:amino acid transporter